MQLIPKCLLFNDKLALNLFLFYISNKKTSQKESLKGLSLDITCHELDIYTKSVYELEEFDFQILKILDKNSRTSYSEISRILGSSVRKILTHIDKMLDLGVIEKFKVNFNYSRLGFRQHIAFMRPPKGSEAISYFEEIQKIPEIERIWKEFTGNYTFTILSNNAKHLEEVNNELSKIGMNLLGRSEVRNHLFPDIPFSSLDWQILYYMFKNSRAAISKIASDLDVSKKTISRRLKRFETMKLVQYTTVINFEAITHYNTAIASFETIGPSKQVYQKIKADSSIKYWRSAGSVSPSIVLFLYGKNLTEIYDNYQKLLNRHDIKFGRISLVVKNWENSNLIEDAILEKIQS